MSTDEAVGQIGCMKIVKIFLKLHFYNGSAWKMGDYVQVIFWRQMMKVAKNSVFAVAILTSCSSVPQFDNEDPGVIAQLSNVVECEVLKTFQEFHSKSKFEPGNWLLTYTITSKSEEIAGASADPLGWVIPAHIDKLIVNGSAGAKRDATRTGTVEYNPVLNKDPKAACAAEKQSHLKVRPADFKLQEWTSQIAAANSTPYIFSYAVDVVVTVNGSLGADLGDGHFSGTLGVNGSRETTRTVNFNFAQIPLSEPTKVFVTNFPKGVVQVPAGPGTQKGKPGSSYNEVVPQGKITVSPDADGGARRDLNGAIDLNHFQQNQYLLNNIPKSLK